MLIDYQDKELTQKYQLMAQTIIPRPIAWVVTEYDGIVNVAPFSYFIGLSSEPASLLVSIGHKPDGTPKDTLRNIRNTKKCTICMVDENFLEKMHFSSKGLDENTSEIKYFDIKTELIYEDFPPIVKGIPAAFFCEFNQEIILERSATIPVILNIKYQYIDDSCVDANNEKLTVKFNPIARIGKSYALLGDEIKPPKIP